MLKRTGAIKRTVILIIDCVPVIFERIRAYAPFFLSILEFAFVASKRKALPAPDCDALAKEKNNSEATINKKLFAKVKVTIATSLEKEAIFKTIWCPQRSDIHPVGISSTAVAIAPTL